MLVIILILLVAVPIVIKLFTRRYANPYKLYMVFGKKGSGKSTYLVKLARRYLKKGWHVYTNMDDMMIDGVRWFDLDHLGDYVPEENSVLLLDEVGMIWDARDYKKFKPAVRDFFKLQRHYHVICYLASQTFDIDKKLRDLTDGMYLHINVLNVLSVGKMIYKKIVLTESTSDAESRISENLKFSAPFNWTFTYIPKYAKYFDSYNIPNKPQLPYRELASRDAQEQIRQNENPDRKKAEKSEKLETLETP